MFVIGDKDTVIDAEIGELIELEGILNGTRLVVTRGLVDASGVNVLLTSLDASGHAIGRAVVHANEQLFSFMIDKYSGGTSIVIGTGANVPRALTETTSETFARLVAPKIDKLVENVSNALRDELGDFIASEGIKKLATLAAGQVAKYSAAAEILGILGGAEAGVGAVAAITATAAEGIVESLSGFIVYELNLHLGNYHSQAEQDEALITLVWPGLGKGLDAYKIVDASKEVVQSMAAALAARALCGRDQYGRPDQ